MTNSLPSLLVALADHAAIVKVNGRANFTTSVAFKRLFTALAQRGLEKFILDLSDCITMDSTFLGVLAGTALKLAEASPLPHNGIPRHLSPPSSLHLINPNPRVSDLLDNLGISDLFLTVHCQTVSSDGEYEAAPADVHPSRQELSRTCLEAHQVLMDLNPENIPKFKDVAQFLAEDLKRLTSDASAKKVHPEKP